MVDTKFTKIIETDDFFGTTKKIEIKTPNGTVYLDLNLVTGKHYSDFRMSLSKDTESSEDLLNGLTNLKKQMFSCDSKKTYEEFIESADYITPKIIDLAYDMIQKELYNNIEKFVFDIKENEMFGYVEELKVKYDDIIYTFSRKNLKATDYENLKKSVVNKTIEKETLNLINRLVTTDKEISLIDKIFSSNMILYVALDAGRRLMLGEHEEAF